MMMMMMSNVVRHPVAGDLSLMWKSWTAAGVFLNSDYTCRMHIAIAIVFILYRMCDKIKIKEATVKQNKANQIVLLQQFHRTTRPYARTLATQRPYIRVLCNFAQPRREAICTAIKQTIVVLHCSFFALERTAAINHNYTKSDSTDNVVYANAEA